MATIVARRVAHPPRRPILAVTAGLNAALAWLGAAGLATGALAMGEDLDARLPYESPVLAGAALASLVAVPLTMLARAAWRDDPSTDGLALTSGALLVGWIGVQMLVLQTFSWFQPTYVMIGLGLALAGLHGREQSSTPTHR